MVSRGTAKAVDESRPAGADVDAATRRLGEVEQLAGVGSWEWDIARDVAWWSEEMYRILGVEPDQFEATLDAYLGCLHPDDRGSPGEPPSGRSRCSSHTMPISA